jgi:hypothetical protein
LSSKITILTGTSGFVIGDNSVARGAGSKVINQFLPQFDAAVRTVQAFRAPSVQNLKAPTNDEYNESTVFAPEITYEFESGSQKAAFLFGLRKKVPAVANVEFVAEGTRWYLLNAKLRPITTVEEYEVSITLRWTISGGILETSLPARTPE